MKSRLPFFPHLRSYHLLDFLERVVFAVLFLAGLVPLLKDAIVSVWQLLSY
jgi:hypothetical protein